jgi:uncharacterized Zn finger protein
MSEYIPSETNQHSVFKTNQLKVSYYCMKCGQTGWLKRKQTLKKTYYKIRCHISKYDLHYTDT